MHSTTNKERKMELVNTVSMDRGRRRNSELTASLEFDTVHGDRSRRVEISLLVGSEPIADQLLKLIELRLRSSPSDVHGKSFGHVS